MTAQGPVAVVNAFGETTGLDNPAPVAQTFSVNQDLADPDHTHGEAHHLEHAQGMLRRLVPQLRTFERTGRAHEGATV